MKKIIAFILTIALTAPLSITASAAYYSFRAQSNNDFHRSTLFEEINGSQFNFGGPNVTDFNTSVQLRGFFSPTPQTSAPGPLVPGISPSHDISGLHVTEFTYTISPWHDTFSPSGELIRTDGSIGTLVIPSLSISHRVFEGATQESMRRGLGHFSETSAWNGNIGISGHNRGAVHTIGSIRNLNIGDIIEFTTDLGTRTYAVTFVGNISSTDWSLLEPTPDNRITLITCLANHPQLRVAVQAVEVT